MGQTAHGLGLLGDVVLQVRIFHTLFQRYALDRIKPMRSRKL